MNMNITWFEYAEAAKQALDSHHVYSELVSENQSGTKKEKEKSKKKIDKEEDKIYLEFRKHPQSDPPFWLGREAWLV